MSKPFVVGVPGTDIIDRLDLGELRQNLFGK